MLFMVYSFESNGIKKYGRVDDEQQKYCKNYKIYNTNIDTVARRACTTLIINVFVLSFVVIIVLIEP